MGVMFTFDDGQCEPWVGPDVADPSRAAARGQPRQSLNCVLVRKRATGGEAGSVALRAQARAGVRWRARRFGAVEVVLARAAGCAGYSAWTVPERWRDWQWRNDRRLSKSAINRSSGEPRAG